MKFSFITQLLSNFPFESTTFTWTIQKDNRKRLPDHPMIRLIEFLAKYKNEVKSDEELNIEQTMELMDICRDYNAYNNYYNSSSPEPVKKVFDAILNFNSAEMEAYFRISKALPPSSHELEYIDRIKSHKNQEEILSLLEDFKNAGINIDKHHFEYFLIGCEAGYLESIKALVEILKNAQPSKLNQHIFKAIFGYEGINNDWYAPDLMLSTLKVLKENDLLTPDNIDFIESIHLVEHITYDDDSSLFGTTNNVLYFHDLLINLRKSFLLTQKNFELIAADQHFCRGVTMLSATGLLTNQEGQANFALLRSSYGKCFRILERLCEKEILNQQNFNQISLYPEILFSDEMLSMLFHFPRHLFDQQTFNEIIQHCQEANDDFHAAIQAIENCMEILRNGDTDLEDDLEEDLEQENQGINYPQSTHNKSVHKTVSESAMRLYKQYGDQIQTPESFKEIINEIKKWAAKFSDLDPLNLTKGKLEQPILIQKVSLDTKKAAAKRAIFDRRILEIDFIDPRSNLTMGEMFALYWLAAHDDMLRNPNTTVEEAENLLVDALYETQREYGFLNEPEGSIHFYEQGEEDITCCEGGSFNKPAEKFHSVHPLVNVEMLTKQLAEMRLPILVTEIAREHLTQLQKKLADEEFNTFLEQMLKPENGIEMIWKDIHNKIKSIMHQEFCDVYSSVEELDAYIDQTGIFVNMIDLINEIKVSCASPSSPKKETSNVPASQVGLFANSEYIQINQTLRDLHFIRKTY